MDTCDARYQPSLPPCIKVEWAFLTGGQWQRWQSLYWVKACHWAVALPSLHIRCTSTTAVLKTWTEWDRKISWFIRMSQIMIWKVLLLLNMTWYWQSVHLHVHLLLKRSKIFCVAVSYIYMEECLLPKPTIPSRPIGFHRVIHSVIEWRLIALQDNIFYLAGSTVSPIGLWSSAMQQANPSLFLWPVQQKRHSPR